MPTKLAPPLHCFVLMTIRLATLAMFLTAANPAAAIETTARQAIMIDMTTGDSLLEKNADELMPPASMTKMMTAHIVFERLRDGRLKLDDMLSVSDNAWKKGGAKSGSSTMFLEPGSKVRVEDLLRGIIVQSGNDASIVVAEALAGSESAFADEMTKRAREIGMKNTTFRNATGWPDPEHLSTARDLAILARDTIRTFPGYYHYYSEKEFTYNGIRQGNRNPLLYKNIGADGLKTGHTKASGYGLTASAKRGDRRLILVLNGLPSVKARAQESERILSWGFREFANYALVKGGEPVAEAEVWLGQAETVPLTVERDLVITLPRKARPRMKVTVAYQGPVPAPIEKGERIATLIVTAPGVKEIRVPLVAARSVGQLGMFGRLVAGLQQIILEQIN